MSIKICKDTVFTIQPISEIVIEVLIFTEDWRFGNFGYASDSSLDVLNNVNNIKPFWRIFSKVLVVNIITFRPVLVSLAFSVVLPLCLLARQLCCEQVLFLAASVCVSLFLWLSAQNLENCWPKIDVTWYEYVPW